MTTITINSTKKTLELTKKFTAAAAKFGSDEYVQLQQARRDYPNFRVVTVSAKSSANKNNFKGLTYSYMEAYIAAHDDENHSIMNQYYINRGMVDKNADARPNPLSYKEMKEWFLETYPEIKAFYDKCEETSSKMYSRVA